MNKLQWAQNKIAEYYNQLDNEQYDNLPNEKGKDYRQTQEHRFFISRKIQKDITIASEYKIRYNNTFKVVNDFLSGNPHGPIDGEGKSLFTLNLGNEDASSIVLQKSAIFDFNNLNIELKPRTPNTQIMVGVFNDYINSYLSLPMFRFAFADAVKTSRAYPFAVSMLGWDDKGVFSAGGIQTSTKPGDVTIKNIDPYKFFWDPLSLDLSDASYCFYVDIMNFDKLYASLENKNAFNFSDKDLAKAVHIAKQNITSIQPEIRDRLITTYDQKQVGGEEIIVYFRRNFEDEVVDVYFVMCKDIVIAKTTIKCSELPFAILKEHFVEQSFLGKSSLMLAIPYIKQKMIIDATAQNIILLSKSPVYLVPKTSGISPNALLDIDGNNAPKVVFTNANPTESAVMLDRGAITQDTLMWRQNIEADLQKVVGINDAQSGYGFGSATNGAAVNAMVQQATIRENDSLVELNKYLVRTTNILIQLIKNNLFNNAQEETQQFINENGEVVSGRKNKRVTVRVDNPNADRSKNASYLFYEFNKNDLTMIDLDINVNVETLRIAKKEQQRQELFTLMQWSMQYQSNEPLVTAEELIDTLNLPNKGQVLSRLNQTKMQAAIEKGAKILEIYDQMSQDPNLANLPKEQAYMMAASIIRAQTLPRKEPTIDEIGAQVDAMQASAQDNQVAMEQALASGQTEQQQMFTQQQTDADADAYLLQLLQEGE